MERGSQSLANQSAKRFFLGVFTTYSCAMLQNGSMPNIASVLKDEIARVARKEVRAEIAGPKKASTAHRSEIAALKRRLHDLERQVRSLTANSARKSATTETKQAVKPPRFSASGFASNRKRLGLSAEQIGLLLGASGQSVYNWEAGKVRPRDSMLRSIAELRSMGKKQVQAKLQTLQQSA